VLYDFKDSHEESAQIITLAMRLLYHLVTKYDNIIDMQKKIVSHPWRLSEISTLFVKIELFRG